MPYSSSCKEQQKSHCHANDGNHSDLHAPLLSSSISRRLVLNCKSALCHKQHFCLSHGNRDRIANNAIFLSSDRMALAHSGNIPAVFVPAVLPTRSGGCVGSMGTDILVL